MKLQPAQIEYLSKEILKILEDEGFIEIDDQNEAYNAVHSIVTDDFMLEEDLDAEVRQILEQYTEMINQDRIQYHQMFKMVKEKLAKERKLIL